MKAVFAVGRSDGGPGGSGHRLEAGGTAVAPSLIGVVPADRPQQGEGPFNPPSPEPVAEGPFNPPSPAPLAEGPFNPPSPAA